MNGQEASGWLTVLILAGTFATYFLKQIGREYVKKLPGEYAGFADAYRRFMKSMIGKHRFFGTAALILLLVHSCPALVRSTVSPSGLVAGLFLAASAGWGLYGFFCKRSLRSGWLPVHQTLAFLLLLAVVVHLFFKGPVAVK